MLDKICQDKRILEKFLKISQITPKQVTSTKIDNDLDYEFYKAQLDRDEDKRNMLLQQIEKNNLKNPILNPFIEIINKNYESLFKIAQEQVENQNNKNNQEGGELFLLLFAENPRKGSKVPRNIWRYALKELFTNKKSNVLNSIQALTMANTQQSLNNSTKIFKTPNTNIQIEDLYSEELRDNLTAREKLSLMDSKIQEIASIPELFLLSHLLEPQIPKSFKKDLFTFKKFIDQYIIQLESNLNNIELAEAEEDINVFFDMFIDFIKQNMDTQKRFTKTNTMAEETSRDLQEIALKKIQQLDLDNLVDDIIKSPFYKLPSHLRAELYGNKILIKELIKATIQSEVVFNIKEKRKIPLRHKVGKKGKLAKIDLVYHFLNLAIKKIESDPKKQEELIRRALLLTKEKYTKHGKDNDSEIYGRIFQHITPMIKSGLISKYVRNTGKEFDELTTEEKNNIVKQVHMTVYPLFPVTDFSKSKYKAKTAKYDEEKHKELTEKQIREKLGLNDELYQSRESNTLAVLIKKYAFNKKFLKATN